MHKIQKDDKNPQHPKWKEYEKDRTEILSNLCSKDASGKPEMFNGQYKIIPGNMAAYNKCIARLDNRIPEVKKEINELNSENATLMESDISITLHKVSMDFFPDMSPKELNILEIMRK